MITLFIVLLSIFVLLYLVSMFMGKEMHIERTINMNRPKSVVFEYLKQTKNQDYFSVWNMKDPNMTKSYTGQDGTVGFSYSWDSPTDKSVGAGKQTITEIIEGERIVYQIAFERPMKNVAQSQFLLKQISETETAVTWDFNGP
ncbi:MAG: SRPBCC family protein, partial [Bacteroidota bacterium]